MRRLKRAGFVITVVHDVDVDGSYHGKRYEVRWRTDTSPGGNA